MSQSLACALSRPHNVSTIGHAPFTVIEGGRNRGMAQTSRITRLERKAHLVVCLLAVCIALVLGMIWRQVDARNRARVEALLTGCDLTLVTIMPGDTLWGIAEEYPVEGCRTSAVVQYIMSCNDLDNASLQAGMQLYVPLNQGMERQASS